VSVECFRRSDPPRVLIAGAGVAGLETLLALRALAGDRVDITVMAPELQFVNQSISVDRPFQPRRGRGIRLERVLTEFDARWVRGKLDCVIPERRIAVSSDREQIAYDMLVCAPGSRPKQWVSHSLFYRYGSHAMSYCGGPDNPEFRLLLQRIHAGRVNKVAFLRPAGPSWPLPLYDLALMTAAQCAARGSSEVELSLVTPEEEPLHMFGSRASAAVRGLLEDSGVTLHTASYGEPIRPGWLEISPGDRGMEVDRVVTEPRLVGPHLRGLPCDRDGFIPTDAHGCVRDLPGVFAAGDATSFPIKQGGLAAQQADAVAETIAASVGIDIDPRPLRPVLRGVLLTGGSPRFLRADVSGGAGDDSTISRRALWWPPTKLAGRYLAPYLSSQIGEAADVMPQAAEGLPVETDVEAELSPEAPAEWPVLADVAHTGPT
jgi:sulfide:quinone oxidoreductase